MTRLADTVPGGRICPVCGDTVPTSRGPLAIYCSRKCQLVAKGRRHRGGLAKHPAMQTCVVCGTQFPQTPRSQAMKYCSMRCAGRASYRRGHGLPVADDAQTRKPIGDRICPACGELLPASRDPQAIYCSAKCRRAAYAQRQRAAHLADPPKMRTCAVCGERFPQALHARTMKYCSKRCASRAAQRRRRGLPIAEPRGEGRICPVCGGFLPASLRSLAIYCSAKCKSVADGRRRWGSLADPPAVQSCVVCGQRLSHRADNRTMKYCSKRCASRGTQRRLRGLPIADEAQLADPRRQGRICPVCGELVPVSRRLQVIYCSPKCASHAGCRRQRGVPVASSSVERTCEVCGQQISQDMHPQATKYCSLRCSGRARYRRGHGLPIADEAQLADPRRQGRICPVCGGLLPASRGLRAIYCSPKCAKVAGQRDSVTSPLVLRTCMVCGTELSRTRHSRAVMYCSRRCAGRANQRRHKGVAIADPSPGDRVCPVCGKGLPASRNLGAVYCSAHCAQLAGNRRHRGLAVADPPTVRSCLVCGAQFLRQSRGAPTKYCSAQCGLRAFRRERQGLPIADEAQLADSQGQGRICPTCGGLLPVSRGAHAIYCSAKCQHVAKSRRQRVNRNAERPDLRACAVCGEQLPEQLSGRPVKKYCSERCKFRAFRRRRQGLPIADEAQAADLRCQGRICPACGELLTESLGPRAIYCSAKCRRVAVSRRRRARSPSVC
jgi:endogenous inhibitor of DNA gyrase (YacG/DUF329 family)